MNKLLLIAFFLMVFFVGQAQESKDILKMLVDKEMISQEDADALIEESQKKQQPSTIQKVKNAFNSDAFRLSGYGQIIYNLTENTNHGFIRTGANNSIDVARAILFAVGKLGSSNQYGYMLMYDFGPNPMLHELYGEWLPNTYANVRFGQFKIPFTIENPMSPTRIETIYFTRSASAMSGSAGDFNQYGPLGVSTGVKAGRDAGLQVSGKLFPEKDFYLLEYYTGLFNGTGMNTKDNNNHKDFIASAYFQPLKGLRVGGSVYSGKLYGQYAGDISGQSLPSLPSNHVRNHWAASMEYSGEHFYARSEYMQANDGGLYRNGIYGSAVWKIVPDKWEVLGKYDYYDPDKNISRNEVSDITAGINYYFTFLSRIQLNYIYTDNKALGKNNMLAAQLQVFF